MLIQAIRRMEVEGVKTLLGDELSESTDFYYQIANREFFRQTESSKKFFGVNSDFPNRSFAFIYLRPVDFLSKQFIMKARSQVTRGIIFNNNSVPEDIDNFLFKFSEIKRANRSYDKLKAINDEIESKHKEKKKEVREHNTPLKEENKEMEKAWKSEKKAMKKEWESEKADLLVKFKESLKDLNDEQKEFMPKEPPYAPEPEYPSEPKYHTLMPKPNDPVLRDLPRSKTISIGDDNLQRRYPIAWKLLSTFEYLNIEGTRFGILKKRVEPLKYTYGNLESLNVDGVISRDDFLKFFKEHEQNEKVLDNYRPSLAMNSEFLDLISENFNLEDREYWIYNEDEDTSIIREDLPFLAPIKPMHAASILLAGMNFSKKVKTDKGVFLIKSAPVKVYAEREQVINGKRITTIIQTHDTKLGFYDLDQRKFEMFSGTDA